MAREQFITFTIDAQEYGVDVMAIREIKAWTHSTDLPETPAYVRGVINLRGTIVPIFDLRARFGGEITRATARHVIIVLSVHDHMVGILADAVADILSVSGDDIRPVPDIEGRHDGGALAGLVPVEQRMVALLDLDRLFQFDIDHIAAAAQAA